MFTFLSDFSNLLTRSDKKANSLCHALAILSVIFSVALGSQSPDTNLDEDLCLRRTPSLTSTSPPPWAQPNQTASTAACRCYPGDSCWPSIEIWDAFNKTIGGRLTSTVPLAAPCHEDAFGPYNATECAALQAEWFSPEIHLDSPSSIMNPYFANNSCNPFLPKAAPCIIGTYASYSVNVHEAMDIARTLWFATYFNIRVVVKNTGHDYNGKSTGAGAISLWTHNLKDIEFTDYVSAEYTGKAIKVAAGVETQEAFAAASAKNLAVVGGECPTVGYAGGYTQGGGHSALSSKYGLAADQVLEWEVVDGQGRLLKASRSVNPDLYWALSGGGGGTYGVVTSMTSKAYPDIPVTGATLSFSNAGISADRFYNLVEVFLASLPDIVDSGAMTVSFLTNEIFAISPLTAPGLSPDQVKLLLSPLTKQLEQYNVSYSYNVTLFPGYYQQFSAQTACGDVGRGLYGGRFIPRSVVEEKIAPLVAAYRYINDHGGTVALLGLNVSHAVSGSNVWNSVNPAWRGTLVESVIQLAYNQTASIEDNKKVQDQITYDLLPRLAELTPDGGAYLNEGDFQQPEWQRVFYGDNYQKLESIKDLYDPFHLFYGITAVGSEYWSAREDGRLCRT
ncbi:FAD/FMN-containing isoamyl alcohol oxidase MreA [Xylariaceae sp. FL0594]|nr:FAD/FMN-containing isoamyl alcohol oxidase MreA [Xylariaceae sp. FL0594]